MTEQESSDALAEYQQHIADCIELAKQGRATDDEWRTIECAAGVYRLPMVTSHPELIDETLPF